MAPSTPVDPRFARKVRELMKSNEMPIAQLAEATNIEPSHLSRILSDNDSTRRAPQFDHVLAVARALGVRVAELIDGTAITEAAFEWIPRAQFEKESKAREGAQSEATAARDAVASLRAQIDSVKREDAALRKRLTAAESQVRDLRHENAGLAAEATSAKKQKDAAILNAYQNYNACVHALAQVESMKKQLEGANNTAGWGWTLAGLGALSTVLAAANNSEGPKNRRK